MNKKWDLDIWICFGGILLMAAIAGMSYISLSDAMKKTEKSVAELRYSLVRYSLAGVQDSKELPLLLMQNIMKDYYISITPKPPEPPKPQKPNRITVVVDNGQFTNTAIPLNYDPNKVESVIVKNSNFIGQLETCDKKKK